MHSEYGFYSSSSVEPLEGLMPWVLIKEEAQGCRLPGEDPDPHWGVVCVGLCVYIHVHVHAQVCKHVHAYSWWLRLDL